MSVGYWSTEIFLPPCATCNHDVYSHLRHETGIPRRRCTQHTPSPCGCKRYELGDPKDWPETIPVMLPVDP